MPPAPSYPRGSEWRKWDLHVHTPSSYDYKNMGATNPEIIQALVDAGVAACAITDHHTIDVGRIRALQIAAAGRVTIFPGVELRTELGGSSLVHITGIFPEHCDLADVWTKLSGALDITDADVKHKGNDRVYVHLEASAKVIHDLGGMVAIHAGQKSNTIEEVRNNELYKQEMKKDLLRDAIDILEVGKAADVKDYEGVVFPTIGFRRPVCWFSDNHDARAYAPAGPCWIKADPTFEGLKQIRNEPADRVFIGGVPPSVARTAKRATRVATSLAIRRLPSATTKERWFDCDLPLNAELIAVIGNKGSGKSALSDTLGLLGNTPRFGSFSFLNPGRFRSPKSNKARQFGARLTWADETVDTVPSLDWNPGADAVEKIKYIPQNYLEEICNELGSGKGSRFYGELQQVIFSHVEEVDRLGFGTLDELLAHRTAETEQAIEQLVKALRECNEKCVAARARASAAHRKAIEAQLLERKREREAHALTKPKELPKPAGGEKREGTKEETELEAKQAELKVLEKELRALRAADAAAARKRATAEKLLGKVKNLQRQMNSFSADIQIDLDELKLQASDILTVTIDTAPIVKCGAALDAERKEIAEKLDPENVESLEDKRRMVAEAIEKLQLQLSAPERAYQTYLQALKEWETAEQEISGSEDVVGSVKYLEKQLAALDALPKELKDLQERQERTLLEIYGEKQKLRSYYEAYFSGVQKFFREHPLAADEQFKLTFNVSMAEAGFADGFLGRLNRRKFGPFMGEEDGTTEMRRLLDGADFESAEGTAGFVRTLFETMQERSGKVLTLEGQLRQGASLQDVYDFVYSLEYLSPIYNLRWDGKGLEQLSPGERGNLLLIFYLLVDRDDVPLVIDQPEENLDNHTVYRTLVPCIKDAKKRRQIMLVTHNPNLAVVCDAEQVICAEMRKESGNEVSYISGAIEDPIINRHIVDILEGTRPAFDKRDDKYIA